MGDWEQVDFTLNIFCFNYKPTAFIPHINSNHNASDNNNNLCGTSAVFSHFRFYLMCSHLWLSQLNGQMNQLIVDTHKKNRTHRNAFRANERPIWMHTKKQTHFAHAAACSNEQIAKCFLKFNENAIIRQLKASTLIRLHIFFYYSTGWALFNDCDDDFK